MCASLSFVFCLSLSVWNHRLVGLHPPDSRSCTFLYPQRQGMYRQHKRLSVILLKFDLSCLNLVNLSFVHNYAHYILKR